MHHTAVHGKPSRDWREIPKRQLEGWGIVASLGIPETKKKKKTPAKKQTYLVPKVRGLTEMTSTPAAQPSYMCAQNRLETRAGGGP